ncbi:related to endo-1,3(4)-beta-glucanase [Serendipita indica DSM 11827]|uniref:Related to endo-1,3(4)-beta-glucanase n=1 Tax=Serendipita indica (strain DSM 11827) TaxID=1109443 RepID=G4TV93_SERID|nr:related to endo-1,3(4)-beta-glucanase [Serendipita indica DSM 11827]
MKFLLTLFTASTLLCGPVQATFYHLTDKWVGQDFLDAFAWENITDPTRGRVNYITQADSLAMNLTYAHGDRFIIRPDSVSVLDPNGPGRASNRIISKKTFGHNTVIIADVRHMPQGCGTWPALWSTDVPWPDKGEIDIVEGVNDLGPNQITLHTTANCTMPEVRPQTGTPRFNDCYWEANNYAACGVKTNKPNSYGPDFNAAGGGWFAMERTPTYIRSWFWSRNDPTVPWEVKNPHSFFIGTPFWGLPVANFPNNSCDIASKFSPHHVIINLTFCGDWAGNDYGLSTCPGTCVDYVNNNPQAFVDAYWDIASIRMYGW